MPTFQLRLRLAVPSHSLWVAMAETTELFPKLAPHIISDIKVIEGEDAEVDSIRHIKYKSNQTGGKYVKEKLIYVDLDGMEATTMEIEGGHLAEGFTKWEMTLRIDSIDAQTCIIRISVNYDCKSGFNPEANIARSQAEMRSLLKRMEQYIVKTGLYSVDRIYTPNTQKVA
ncbi:hypothetical protein R1sor_026825 [Riccia sorocarpa]|uniref:Bet v I/Major latex protein domain-containing protein n=1 Tax=Riccia sorocarpa TaxID=122646 RepID=A0ABD3GCH1_9MARC